MSFLRKLHEELKLACQPTSCYLNRIHATEKNKVQTTGDKAGDIQIKTCQFCGTDYSYSQQRVRLRPRVGLNKKLKRLLQRNKAEPGSLGKCQLNMVQQYLNSYNHLLVTCSICKKISKYPCSKRSDILKKKTPPIQDNFRSQNTGTGKKKKKKKKKEKVESTKSVIERQDLRGQGNTHDHSISTPILSNVSTSSSVIKTALGISQKKTNLDTATSSKSAKKKKGKNIHQQLNKMLAKEKSELKSGTLKDFLSTL